MEEEQQNQHYAGNDNESDTAYNEGDNSENPWRKSQTQQETAVAPTNAPNPTKSGIYVPFTGDVSPKKNQLVLVMFIIYFIELKGKEKECTGLEQ